MKKINRKTEFLNCVRSISYVIVTPKQKWCALAQSVSKLQVNTVMVSYLYPLYICVCVRLYFYDLANTFFLFIVAPFELCWKWIYKETHLFEVLSFSTSPLLFWIFRSFCGFLRIRFASLVSFNLFEMIAKSTNNFIFYTIIVAFHVPQFLFRYDPLLIVTTMMKIIIRFSAIIHTNSHTNICTYTLRYDMLEW